LALAGNRLISYLISMRWTVAIVRKRHDQRRAALLNNAVIAYNTEEGG
jgi:hypothetical protein